MALKISIIGAGGWGTALAHTLARRGHSVRLWAYEREVSEEIQSLRENSVYLAGIPLAECFGCTHNLDEALEAAEIVVLAMPSHTARAMYEQILPRTQGKVVFVSATKGMDTDRIMCMSEVFRSVAGEKFEPR